ncbi:hypothetical protein SAMN05216359_104244 [Roseateles sp. YR242]|uniref:hypothetical protein n=1 Tax=Roseateles sp. YR242 TaxID=1855305 RepID=UPI0008CF3448|nr:hypothetical protein [Roseateles sp. YR242]SEK99176.1 hypothetical protein SAMN05216359_104244 [Roseateles sp. YR242]
MYLVAIGWMYVVLMMAAAEAMNPQGTVLGALVTFVLYGVLPLSIVLYVMGAPRRREARRRAQAQGEPTTHGDADLNAAVGDEVTSEVTAEERPK